MKTFKSITLFAIVLCSGCSPQILVVDRLNQWEEVQNGIYPNYQKELSWKELPTGPIAIEKVPKSKEEEKNITILAPQL